MQAIFMDINTGDRMLLETTRANSKQTDTWTDGKHYPVITVPVSRFSHPAYFDDNTTIKPNSTMIDKFYQKYPDYL